MSATQQVGLEQMAPRVGGVITAIGADKFAPIWPGVAQMVVSDVKRGMNEGRSPNGKPFVPLAHGRPGQPTGALPLRDRGLLLASIVGRADAMGVVVSTNHQSAAVHQFGAVIVPRKAKALAIPLTHEAKRSGGPRRMQGLFVLKLRGKAFLAERKPDKRHKDGYRLEFHWMLVSQVKIPARPFLGFSEGLIERVEMLVIEHATKLIDGQMNGGT